MLDAKRQLLLGISHELRSPLSRLRLALEFVADGEQKEQLRAFDESLQNGTNHSPRARSWLEGVKQFFERMGA